MVLSLYFLPPLPLTSPPSLPSSSPFPPPTLLVFISPPPFILSNIFLPVFPLFSPGPVLYLIFSLPNFLIRITTAFTTWIIIHLCVTGCPARLLRNNLIRKWKIYTFPAREFVDAAFSAIFTRLFSHKCTAVMVYPSSTSHKKNGRIFLLNFEFLISRSISGLNSTLRTADMVYPSSTLPNGKISFFSFSQEVKDVLTTYQDNSRPT